MNTVKNMRCLGNVFNHPQYLVDHAVEKNIESDKHYQDRVDAIREEFVHDNELRMLNNIFTMYDDFTKCEMGKSYYPISVVMLGAARLLELQFFTKKQKIIKYETGYYEKITVELNGTETVIPKTKNHFMIIAKTFFFETRNQLTQFQSFVCLTMPSFELDLVFCRFPLSKKQLAIKPLMGSFLTID